jgi:oxaloacetate decarboxylase beta subunit
MGVGAMTDFGPLLSNPISLLLGAAAQLGVYCAFIIAILSGQFTPQEAASIAIIGGADGPTAIFLASKLASHLLAPIALAAYSYMALIPIIQPPIMKLLTTEKERKVEMKQLRTVSKTEKIVFPVAVLIVCAALLPSVVPLLGMLMLGNLLKECAVTDRLSDTAQNALMNIVTILLGVTVGATANGQDFLQLKTLLIVLLGFGAFCFSTAGGVIFGKILYVVTKGKINPLIGAAGVSAVPMAARVAQNVGRKYNPTNFLLMHAMGPNVAGVIGSAVAAGFLLALFGQN